MHRLFLQIAEHFHKQSIAILPIVVTFNPSLFTIPIALYIKAHNESDDYDLRFSNSINFNN